MGAKREQMTFGFYPSRESLVAVRSTRARPGHLGEDRAEWNRSEQRPPQDQIGDAEVDDEAGHVHEGGHEGRGGARWIEA